MSTHQPSHDELHDPDPLATPADAELLRSEIPALDSQAFFARLDAELDASNVQPAHPWFARTIGQIDCNPVSRRRAIAVCSVALVGSLGVIANAVRIANLPEAPLALPPGYVLVHRAQGQPMAVPGDFGDASMNELDQDVWLELQRLMATPPTEAQPVGISASATVGTP